MPRLFQKRSLSCFALLAILGVLALPLAADVHRLVHPHGAGHHSVESGSGSEHAAQEHTGESAFHQATRWQACAFCDCIAPRPVWLFASITARLRTQLPAASLSFAYTTTVDAVDLRTPHSRAPPVFL